ncbi:hypothetical protein [Lysinibacillus xylanilyticus]|uniref:hypothetical protein n=1 Tax=Lysinibacillus xylanilyticus TaxID=582475 RepID=UPI003CFC5E5E
MAASIGISEFTSQDYDRSALRKLDAFNRVQGVTEALGKRVALHYNQLKWAYISKISTKKSFKCLIKQKEI